jgi:hypothetical protein
LREDVSETRSSIAGKIKSRKINVGGTTPRARAYVFRITSVRIVNLTLLRVTQYIVRLGNLLKLLFCLFVPRVDVWMMFASKFTVCLFDLVCRSVALDSKDTIVIVVAHVRLESLGILTGALPHFDLEFFTALFLGQAHS